MSYKIPKVKKAEYGTQRFFKTRAKYYIFGVSVGVGLLGDAIARSRDPYEAFAGWVILGNSLLGYSIDYKHQISLKEGFKAKKIYTFADGTKILADSEKNAKQTYTLHKHHQTHPHHFSLFNMGEKK
jgi:hypothetical protein